VIESLINKHAGFLLNLFQSETNFYDLTLSPGGYKILTTPNAGGSSIESEVMSFELMRLIFGAKLFRTEMEIEYFPIGGSITDYSVRIGPLSVSVSVTRAMKFRKKNDNVFTNADAERLLMKKLSGCVNAKRNTLEKWDVCVLHVWVEKPYMCGVLMSVYQQLDLKIKSNTVVICTVAENANWLFYPVV